MGKIGGIALIGVLGLAAGAAPASKAESIPDPANPASYDSSYSADEFFIAGVKLKWEGDLPSNTRLVELGSQACEGQTADDANGKRIQEYARAVYCP